MPAPKSVGGSQEAASFQLEVDLMEMSDKSMFKGDPGAEPE